MTSPIEQLTAQVRAIVTLQAEIPSLVAQARAAGTSWRDIGRALEISRQGAQQRYAAYCAAAPADPADTEPIEAD